MSKKQQEGIAFLKYIDLFQSKTIHNHQDTSNFLETVFFHTVALFFL